MNTTIVPIIDLTFLAKEISDAHRQVLFHGRSMVSEAIRAGEALIQAKAKHRRGTFISWVEKEAGVPARTAQEYMKAANKSAGARAFLSDGMTLREFLYGEPQKEQRERKKAEAAASFSREDAEYALKIHAMAERGGTEAEQEVARRKLSGFAGQFGMTSEGVVERARALLPEAGLSTGEAARQKAEKAADEADARLSRLDAIEEKLRQELHSASKDQLIEMLAAALFRLEEAGVRA